MTIFGLKMWLEFATRFPAQIMIMSTTHVEMQSS